MPSVNLTVRQLNMYVRSLLEGDSNLSSVTLEGELSGFKNHFGSGHWYFTLKDADAAVKGVMFKGNAIRVNFEPKDGMRVICHGYVSLYEKDGQFQFYAESMRPFGEGDLAAEFERIKQKLSAEGLFDPERKRPLPTFPNKIGIVTSDTGAALQDILQITSRRFPLTDIVVFPSLVQGIAAPASLIKALNAAYKRNDLDLIIIGRGGGSAEDLACFNDEALARKVASSPVPIISAVGHEVDFTICDFVSDLRAPTPSAAAELAVPSADELINGISLALRRMSAATDKYIARAEIRLNNLTQRRCFARPDMLFAPFEQRLDNAVDRLKSAYDLNLRSAEASLKHLEGKLTALSPMNILKRGFSVVYKNDVLLLNTNDLSINDEINIRFAEGEAKCRVTEIK